MVLTKGRRSDPNSRDWQAGRNVTPCQKLTEERFAKLMNKKVKSKFQLLRERAGLTHAEAAAHAGCTARQIRRYETGTHDPSPLYVKFLEDEIARRTKPKETPAAFTFIDLFAGIGGLRLGFESIGGKCVFTSEWDKYCNTTYRANFPSDDHDIAGDIRPYGEHPEKIPKFEVLLAGFPCQPFSIAGVSKKNALGRPHGFDCDKQGTLFFEIERILRHHKPAAFLLENVKNLERHDKGRTFAVIIDTLKGELGYETVEHRVISSEAWVPQKRERIFIAGFRKESAFNFKTFKPGNMHPKLGSILNDHKQVPDRYTLTAHLWRYLQDYKDKHAAKGNGFGCSVFGPNDVTRTLSARYYKDGSEILVEQKDKRPRRLMPIECARLMGFAHPDGREWIIPVSDTQAYKQFGNAVVVPVVKAVAKHMEPYILQAVALDRKKVVKLPVAQKIKAVTSQKKKKKLARG
jgi:DNA (cytosine-5)-methyltransferase 1